MKLHLLASLPAACAMFLLAPPASAAPAPPCIPTTLEPIATAIPANIPGFAVNDLTLRAGDAHFSTAGKDGPAAVVTPVGNVVKITPATPFVVGTSYALQVPLGCVYDEPQDTSSFVVTAEAPIPTAVGEIVGAPTVTTAKLGTTKVSIAATYTLAAEMKPWASVYELGLELDGRVIETHATVANDTVQIAATGWCDAANAATQTHTIKLRGRLPFAPLIETAPTTSTFDCAAAALGNPGASTPLAPAGPSTPGSSSSSSGGCSVTHGAPASSLPLIGLVLGLSALVRRVARKES